MNLEAEIVLILHSHSLTKRSMKVHWVLFKIPRQRSYASCVGYLVAFDIFNDYKL